MAIATLTGFAAVAVSAAEPVTPDNYLRAESDFNFKKKVDEGMFGKFGHVREPAPIDRQVVVRVNRDTLFSWGVFDLTQPVTIVKPDTGKRFQSMVVINEDHYIKAVAYEPGEYVLTREKIGTRYVQVAFRTLVDPAKAYSFNNITAKKDSDGTITIHFGGDPKQLNYIPITKGWNYTVRLYRPRKEILDGSWKFPEPKPIGN